MAFVEYTKIPDTHKNNNLKASSFVAFWMTEEGPGKHTGTK